MAGSTVAKTVSLIADTDKIISEFQQLRDNVLPSHCADLIEKICVTKRSANYLLLTAHMSLRDKIAYEQQSRAVIRQKKMLSEIEGQKRKWTAVLEKAKEQRKQLKRLQKVQQEYEITSHFPNGNAEYKKDLEKRMVVAMDRSLKAQQTYSEIVQQVKAVMDRMEEDSEWRRKQDDLDEKAMERARRVASRPRKMKTKAKAKAKATAKSEDWLPPQYKAKEKKEHVRPNAGGKGKMRH